PTVFDGTSNRLGGGLETLGSMINFKEGLDQTTGNPLDVAIKGDGFFVVKKDGNLFYTRAGSFHFNEEKFLVNSSDQRVQMLQNGRLADISLSNAAVVKAKATANVTISGQLNMPATVPNPSVPQDPPALDVFDANGKKYSLTFDFVQSAAKEFTLRPSDGNAGGSFDQTSFVINFNNTIASPPSINLVYTPPAGGSPIKMKVDLSTGLTAGLATSSLKATQDGAEPGKLASESIDEKGVVVFKYSNGETQNGPQLALANFATVTDLEQADGGNYSLKTGRAVEYAHAGDPTFGTLKAGHREGSNVDLAEEFGNLILMQRGYQASSHVISTANDMIQELFDMKGHR
ncbi:MAG: flagellar hook-basal body complex protein, partial [Burkholderiales bacterium]|nr:flagellar hook-basal body complex protein [Burkholderiales bacterium]